MTAPSSALIDTAPTETITLAPWHRTVSDALAGSLYAVPPELRTHAAHVLADANVAIHLDVIIDTDGDQVGVSLEDLLRVRAERPDARVDVHIIVLELALGATETRQSTRRVRRALLDTLAVSATIRAERVSASPTLLNIEPDAWARVRSSGAEVWAEIVPGDDGMTLPDGADGALVMFIRPGTVDQAAPDRLQVIAELAQTMPVGADGGITAELAQRCVEAGASVVVSGRALLTTTTSSEPHLNSRTGVPPMSTVLPSTSRTSVLTGAKELAIEERPVPQPAADEVLVKVAAVGVCGSDVHYYRHGRIGDFVVDGPLVLGHELSGSIVAVGAGVADSRVGERVAIEPQRPCHRCRQCLAGRYNLCPNMEFYATPPIDGAFTGYVTIQAEFAHPVPDSISDEAAALLEPLSVAITTMRKAGIVPGSRVLIAGAGPIGIICAQTARAFGAAEIIVSDLVPERRERAMKYGATSVIDPAATDVATAGLSVDAFIDASGAPRAVFSGIKAVGPSGRAVLVGLGNSEMTLPVEHIQNLEIIVTGIFRYTDTWPAGIHLVATGQVDLDSLVTGRFDLDHVAEALDSDLDPDSLKSIVYPTK